MHTQRLQSELRAISGAGEEIRAGGWDTKKTDNEEESSIEATPTVQTWEPAPL